MRADTCFEHATKGFLCLECQSKYEALAQKTVRWNHEHIYQASY